MCYISFMASSPTVLSRDAIASSFITPHDAWNPSVTAPRASMTPANNLQDYLNQDGSLTDAAYDLLHEEWISGKMV